MEFLIIDDDFGSRGGMALKLRADYPGCLVHEARSLRDATALLSAHSAVALVLLDLTVDDSRGLRTLESLKTWCEANEVNPRIVIVSAGADYDPTLIPQAIERCATGFIPKGTSEDVFRSAINVTLAGGIFVPQSYLEARRPESSGTPVLDVQALLTPRERQVAALLLRGLTYKQIARRLQAAPQGHTMSDHTVRVHVQRIAWKLRLSERTHIEGLSAKAAVLTAFAEQQLSFTQLDP